MPSGRKCTFLPDWVALTRCLKKKSLKFDFLPCRKRQRRKETKDIYSKSDKER